MRTPAPRHGGVDRTVACGACRRSQALPCRRPGHARRQRQVTGLVDRGDDRRGSPPGDTCETDIYHGPTLRSDNRPGSSPARVTSARRMQPCEGGALSARTTSGILRQLSPGVPGGIGEGNPRTAEGKACRCCPPGSSTTRYKQPARRSPRPRAPALAVLEPLLARTRARRNWPGPYRRAPRPGSSGDRESGHPHCRRVGESRQVDRPPATETIVRKNVTDRDPNTNRTAVTYGSHGLLILGPEGTEWLFGLGLKGCCHPPVGR